MKRLCLQTLLLFLILSLITGILYPLAVTAGAWLCCARQAGGSLIERDGHIVGSSLIGQAFTDPKYFWSRPSATSPAPYDAAGSAGSNLGPTNESWVQSVHDRVAALRAADPSNAAPVPVDLITASASGLDPHISPAAADYQLARVARARGLDPARVRALISRHTEARQWHLLGEPRVNVLTLNLALDSLH